MTKFIMGEKVPLEENFTCEFKEIKEQPPVQAIGKVVDNYVVAFLNEKGGSIYWGIVDDDYRVTGVRLNHKMRDELNQVVGIKIGTIAPAVPKDFYNMLFHPVVHPGDYIMIEDLFVIEVSVQSVSSNLLYLTGNGESYKRTLGGIKKLSGSELLNALITQLQEKIKINEQISQDNSDIAWMPSVSNRAKYVRPLLRGAHILWVDDHPQNTLYERTILSTLGIAVDVALSTNDASFMLSRIKYDLILSDIYREGNPSAGLEMLTLIKQGKIPLIPVIFYIGKLLRNQGTPLGAFAITNRPDDLLHYIFDALERRNTDST